jgi:hypothetical protein
MQNFTNPAPVAADAIMFPISIVELSITGFKVVSDVCLEKDANYTEL